MSKPDHMDAFVVPVATAIFVNRLANSLNPNPAVNAVRLAEDLAEELTNRGYNLSALKFLTVGGEVPA